MVYLYFLLITLATFLASTFLYIKTVGGAAKFFPDFDAGKIIFAIPLLICAPSFFLIRMLTENQTDILFYPSDLLLVATLIGAGLIGVCGLYEKINRFSFVVLALCCGICAYILPEDFALYGLELAPIYKKGAIAASWFLIALGCSVLAVSDGLLSVFVTIFSLAMIVFYAISGISAMQFLFVAIILGIAWGYMIFNWRPAQMKMNFSATLSFGFLFGFVVLGSSAEGMWLPLQIIMLYLYIGLVVYVLQKISFIEPDDENEDKIISCLKLMAILLAIAFMQVYTEISKTLIIVAVMTVLWAKSKIGLNGKKKSFKEINRETIENIKNGMNEIRNYLDKK